MKHSLLRMVTVFLTLILLIECMLGSPVLAVEAEKIEEPDNLYALAACLMDAETGRILYAKNADEKRANASTTKIMTLIVTLEQANLDDIVTVSKNAAKQPDVQLNIKTDENYVLRDLCYSLMLESHNDSAVAIAEHVGGSVEGFAKLMNQKAEEIGCENTYFITPNGLDAKDENGEHGTTAADLAKILSYCILKSPKAEEFLEITGTASYSFSNKNVAADGTVSNGSRSFSCNNHNVFLNMMEGALSGKTGFTNNAGYCYVGSLQRDGRTYVVALLGCGWPNNKSYKWKDTKKLMQYGLDNYEHCTIESMPYDESKVSDLIVENAQTDRIGEVKWMPLTITDSEGVNGILLRTDEEVEIVYEMKKKLQAPVTAGTTVGTITYRVGDYEICKFEVKTAESCEKINFQWCLNEVIEKFLPSCY